MVAHPARDEVRAVGLAALDEVLAHELERDLHCLGPAADEGDSPRAGAGGRARDELRRDRLGGTVGEERRVRVRQRRDLPLHGGDHVGMRVAEARHGRAPGRIEVALAVAVDQPAALAADGMERWCRERAVQDGAGHGGVGALRHGNVD